MKDLRVIQEQIEVCREKEQNNSTTTYSQADKGEMQASYDYAAAQHELHDLQKEERHIKLLLAVSNASTNVEGYDMTIAEALVYLAQLSQNKKYLSRLANKEKLVRQSGHYGSGGPEYTKVNYDLKQAQADLAELHREIAQLQMAIDRTNLTNLIEV